MDIFNRLLNIFRISHEKEHFQVVSDNIERGVVFKSTNLWVLVFAIFIASLGLNVNSTAVIIGAMLVSPLMGPIMGLGFGMAVNDLSLLRKSLANYIFAATIGLTTSTIYFFVSPLNEAHSEILARTSPTIYDVLIALFGGLAGMLATSSLKKGNVIPGVAIATALMPPLCTAGYGLATLQFKFFFGAFYLFFINSVFIALATLLIARVLKHPYKQLPKEEDEVRARRIVLLIVTVTLLPSIYFGWNIVQQTNFLKAANFFVDNVALFPNDYLLKREIDPKERLITLTYGGEYIEEREIQALRAKLESYGLHDTQLEVRQGFTYLKDQAEVNPLTATLSEREKELKRVQQKLDSIVSQQNLNGQILKELRAQFPEVTAYTLQRSQSRDSTDAPSLSAYIVSTASFRRGDRERLTAWLQVRTRQSMNVHFARQ